MAEWTRRRAIGTAAAGIGAAWIAPTIISVPAAGAATAPPAPDFENGFGADGPPGVSPITVTLPVGAVNDGDLLLALGAIRFDDATDAGIDPPAGFAPVLPSTAPAPGTPGGITSRAVPIAPAVEALRAYAWARTWNTGDPLSFTFDKTLAGGFPTRWSAGILVISGASGVGAAAAQGQVGSPATAPAITTTALNSTVLFVAVTSGPTTFGAPGGFTVRGQGPTNAGNPQAFLASLAVPSPTTVGPVSATYTTPVSPPVDDNVGFLIELVP